MKEYTLEESVETLRKILLKRQFIHVWSSAVLKDYMHLEVNNIITSYSDEAWLTNEDLEQIIKLAEVLL